MRTTTKTAANAVRTAITACAACAALSLAAKPPIKVPVPEPSADLGTMPDAAYVTDYYAPPLDAVPVLPVARYTPNVRVPEYRWEKVDGAYALAMRIRPIPVEMLEKEVAVGLIDTNRNKSALSFSLAAEKDAQFRRVAISRLGLDATQFTGLVCRVKATKVRNAGGELTVAVSGRGFGNRAVASGTPDSDGFVRCAMKIVARPGAVIDQIAFEAPPATDADFEQVFDVIDLHLQRPDRKARFTDLPARRWARKADVLDADEPLPAAKCIPDVYAYARGEGAADSRTVLPDAYELRPQGGDDDRDGGFEVEFTEATVAGRDLPAVRITLVKGPRCLLRFPAAFDGLDYNTFTFAAKVETFPGASPLLGDGRPMLQGTNQKELNRPFDTFQIGLISKTDGYFDWMRWGIGQADYRQNRLASSAAKGDGWDGFAYDIANSDPSGNKSSFNSKLTHWCFYYDNRKIPEGKKVVVTIADPRVTRGVMLSGGDIGLYRKFLKSHRPSRMVDFGAMETALEPPGGGHRLPKPIRFVENGRARGAIYLVNNDRFPSGTPRETKERLWGIVRDAAKEFCDVVHRKYGMGEDVSVYDRLPGGKAVVENSIIVGGSAYAKVNKEVYEADMKALKGRSGCAIRSDGTNVYVYAAQYNYSGEVRGLAFGLYELLENNVDVLWPYVKRLPGLRLPKTVRSFSQDGGGTLDLVWGDGFVHASRIPEFNVFGPGENREPGCFWLGELSFGRTRGRSTNHWWGYGTEPHGDEKKGEPNETWGRRADGTFMKPGCYTGHPCLIRVLDRARDSYVEWDVFSPQVDRAHREARPQGKAFAWNCYDVFGLWVEDSISMCQCSECLTPIRLADGSTVGPESPYFRSTQFYSNGSAMITAVNVYGSRDARIESIGYFWMAPVPLVTVSRSYDVRYCPYFRKNYFVPIYAPINDMHWRALYQWAQQDVRLAIYEYFLGVNARPWADVAAYDIAAESDLGVCNWYAENSLWNGERGTMQYLALMDRWVTARVLWGAQGDDVAALRAYYLKRTFREAAEPVGRFYQTLMSLASERLRFDAPMDFEDYSVLLRTAMRTKSRRLFCTTVLDELDGYVRDAEGAAKTFCAMDAVRLFREAWDDYRADAVKNEAEWKKENSAGRD